VGKASRAGKAQRTHAVFESGLQESMMSGPWLSRPQSLHQVAICASAFALRRRRRHGGNPAQHPGGAGVRAQFRSAAGVVGGRCAKAGAAPLAELWSVAGYASALLISHGWRLS